MFPHPRHHNTGWWSGEDQGRIHVAARTLARLLVAEGRPGEWRDARRQRSRPRGPPYWCEPRWFNRQPRGPLRSDTDPGRDQRFQHGTSRRIERRRQPPRAAPVIGEPDYFREEDPPLLLSEHPAGFYMMNGEIGCLAGGFPEALCKEASKGRPMVCRENPEAFCVEAPQGQPAIHSCNTIKPQDQRQTQQEGEKKKKQKQKTHDHYR